LFYSLIIYCSTTSISWRPGLIPPLSSCLWYIVTKEVSVTTFIILQLYRDENDMSLSILHTTGDLKVPFASTGFTPGFSVSCVLLIFLIFASFCLFVCVVCSMISVSLDFPFLLVHSVFSIKSLFICGLTSGDNWAEC
jgi:hypothetical protein